jgi:hypothetical protein
LYETKIKYRTDNSAFAMRITTSDYLDIYKDASFNWVEISTIKEISSNVAMEPDFGYYGFTTGIFDLAYFQIRKINGLNNYGTMKGNMILNQPAHPYAFEFDGVDDYVDFGDVCDVGTNDFILFAWIKHTDSWHEVLTKKNSNAVGDTGYYLAYQSNKLKCLISDGVNQVQNTLDGTSLNTGDWYFVCVVVNRNAGKFYRYVNGVLDGTNPTDISSVTGSLNNDKKFLIGRLAGIASYYPGSLGISGIYIFDGQNGASLKLPSNYEQIIRTIYNNTKHLYQ